MNGEIKVSIIIPSFCPQEYLWDCLNSLENQTFDKKLFEIILILNGCREPYQSAINDYIKKHPSLQIVFIQTDKGGVSNARNIGIDASKGEYIAFIDDDDYVSSTYIEELYTKAKPDVVSVCYPLSFIEGTSDFFPYNITKDYIKNEKASLCYYTKARRFFTGPVYKLIHRDIIGNRRFDIRFKNGEDSIFMYLISDRFGIVALSSRKTIYYRRIRPGSAETSKKSNRIIITNCFKMVKELWKIYLNHPSRYSLRFLLAKSFGAVRWALVQMKK